MKALRIDATLEHDGRLAIDGLPLQAGDQVEVIVLVKEESHSSPTFPLRGTIPYHFDDPFSPAVPAEEWEAEQ